MHVIYRKRIRKPRYRRAEGHEFQDLREEVHALVDSLAPEKERLIGIKAVLFPLLFLGTYAVLLSSGNNPYIFFSAYFLLGFFLLLNFLNLIHDAVHGVIFKRYKVLNRFYVYFFDLLGANSYIWQVRHIRLHHAFPNVMNWDSDFEQSPLVRIFPHSPGTRIHKYQHIYLPFIYPLYLFNWLLVRDFKDFFKKDAIVRRVVDIPKKEYVKLFVFKSIFFSYILLVPALVLEVGWGMIFLGFLTMMFTASLFSLMVLLSPHANIHSDFPQVDEKGQMPYSWFRHQLVSTNDVSNDNFFIRFFMGSFNYHIAHHLFPNVHHVYYPEITKVIESFAQKHNLPYRKQSLSESLLGHYALLRNNAYTENIFEETM